MNLSFNILIEVLTKWTLFMIRNLILSARFMFFKNHNRTLRYNVKFMECIDISNLVSNEEIEISRILICLILWRESYLS